MTKLTLDLIRHGEPVGGRRYRGHGCDDPLSDKGWRQMRAAVTGPQPWDAVLSSPLLRCRTFAEELKLPLRVHEDFREVGFGAWEGLSPDQIRQQRPGEYEHYQEDPVLNRPPGAEDLQAFGRRVQSALELCLAETEGRHLLLVAHAGVIRCILGHVLQAPPQRWYRIGVDNAGLSRLNFDALGGMLVFHNRVSLV